MLTRGPISPDEELPCSDGDRHRWADRVVSVSLRAVRSTFSSGGKCLVEAATDEASLRSATQASSIS